MFSIMFLCHCELGALVRLKLTIQRAALKELDIKHLEFASPRNLSTGVRQRICIARFIALRPKVLLINDRIPPS